ncbi:MAG: FAD-dependent oxidoreductase, partial [Microthrixaceae bacterium]|nr:FAD-dependent oxidoreductase [Microthrixaceae bacterium]
YAAKVADTVATASRFGVDARLEGVRWGDIRDRVFGRIDPISAGGRDYRINGANTRAYLGRARFVGDRRVRVRLHEDAEATQAAGVPAGTREVEVSADQVVIAAGAYAQIPDVVRDAGVPFHTSDTIMRIDEIPEHLVVIGGGFIAAEMAHVFGTFGSQVTIIGRSPRVLSHEDWEIGTRFTRALAEHYDLRVHVTVTAVESTPSGVAAHCSDGSIVEGDTLLVAAGRVPNGDELAVERTGVTLDPYGYVITDDALRTDAPGVWALGDIRNPRQLKHLANREADLVGHNLANPDDLRCIDESAVPHVVFSHPEVAQVGLSEEALQALGRPYLVGRRDYGASAYGWAMEDEVGFAKVLVDPDTRLLLGAHILGHEASLLIQPLAQAMALGNSIDDVARTVIYPHPALSEVVEQVLLEVPGAPEAGGRFKPWGG